METISTTVPSDVRERDGDEYTTERIYEQDAYATEFQAQVLRCEPAGGGWKLLLNRTCFFPEGGGQPADRGTLTGDAGMVRVTDVQETDGAIWHHADGALPVGEAVTGAIDWARRFDLTQQHSGEHIVSGVVHTLFGYDNVGFHMGADTITVDWDGVITPEQLAQVERRANQLIWQDAPTEIWFPDARALETLEYRSKKALAGSVRIVRFPGADTCACCGTHVRRAGEIGFVKLLSVQKFRSGVRCEMVAGQRAVDWCTSIGEQNRQTSVLLSAKPMETAQAVERLYQEKESLKRRLAQLEASHHQHMAEQYAGAGDVLLLEAGLDAESVRRLCAAVMERCGGRCAVFSPGSPAVPYAMGQTGGDLRALTKQLNAQLHGRGGGKPFFVQGAVQASEEEIRAFFARQEQLEG